MESIMVMHGHPSVRKNGFEGFQRKHVLNHFQRRLRNTWQFSYDSGTGSNAAIGGAMSKPLVMHVYIPHNMEKELSVVLFNESIISLLLCSILYVGT